MHNDNIYSDLDSVILKAIEIKKNGMVEPIYVGLSNSLEDPLNKSIENSNRLIDATDLFFKEVNLHYYKIGYQEGVNETSIKIAKNLLDVLSIEEISTATSLTIDEIKKLKEQLFIPLNTVSLLNALLKVKLFMILRISLVI